MENKRMKTETNQAGMEMPVGKAMAKVRDAVKAYLTKGPDGCYLIPRVSRIPLYLYGAPGVGKTQGAHQVAKELQIGFVSFSLTHHTRNSLLGLPVVSELAGNKYTEYTMSEIIAQVYKAVEQGYQEGILLLDEFNCASDTIMPAMLEFLQSGNIGTHKLPEGWVLILCGNPQEFNRSAKTFDAAVMDRVRKIEITSDYEDFAEYAKQRELCPIIQDYLSQNPDDLYYVGEKGVSSEGHEGVKSGIGSLQRRGVNRELVTPRGWENLSWAILAYTQAGMEIDEELVHEYLKCERIALDFFQFYWINREAFGVKEAQEILQGQKHSEYAEMVKEKTVTFRWKMIDLLAKSLNSHAKDSSKAEETSDMISNAFRFLAMLPDPDTLQESLVLKLNDSKDVMRVLMKVENKEYLRICGRSYGLKAI